MTAAQARAIADRAATAVLAQQTEEHRRRDPAVALRLEDYRSRVVRRDTAGVDAYDVTYAHANPAVPFVVWTGHPMHFTVRVSSADARPEIIPGE